MNEPVNRRQFLGRLFRSAADSVTPDVGGLAPDAAESEPDAPRRVQRTDVGNPPAAPGAVSPAGSVGSAAGDRPAVPFDQQLVAYIKPIDCLAYGPTICTICSERCPEPDVITLTRMRPTVDTSSCTGCAVCYEVCPAPENAVLIVPRFVVEAQMQQP